MSASSIFPDMAVSPPHLRYTTGTVNPKRKMVIALAEWLIFDAAESTHNLFFFEDKKIYSAMYTHCSFCKTLFGITAQQLAAAQGRVRCSVCRTAFSALDNLSEQPDELLAPGRMPQCGERSLTASCLPPTLVHPCTAQDTQEPPRSPATNGGSPDILTAPPGLTETAIFVPGRSTSASPEEIIAMHGHHSASGLHMEQPGGVTRDEFDLVNAPPITEERFEPDSGAVTPSIIEPKRISLSATLVWSLTNLALMAVLVIQFAYFNRYDLARYAQWRPALEEMCRHARCILPLQSDITKITLVNRELRSHPSVANAILVTATLVNSAVFHQSYPLLQLSLSDFSGRTVAMRRFQPAEYMSQMAEINDGMRPGQPIEVSLELVDPGKTAVGFEFTFI